jgi:hypothetical protein
VRAQQKPFTQEQVSNMVRAGLGDDSGAKPIEQRGIDFAPSEDFIQTLKAAGASEAFLKALRAAVTPGLSPARNVAPTFRSAHADLKVSATTPSPEPAAYHWATEPGLVLSLSRANPLSLPRQNAIARE